MTTRVMTLCLATFNLNKAWSCTKRCLILCDGYYLSVEGTVGFPVSRHLSNENSHDASVAQAARIDAFTAECCVVGVPSKTLQLHAVFIVLACDSQRQPYNGSNTT